MSCKDAFCSFLLQLYLLSARIQAYGDFIVLPAERAQYSAIIDGILNSSDLNTVSAKQISQSLAAALNADISDKKVSTTFPIPIHPIRILSLHFTFHSNTRHANVRWAT
jgi:hypothetical protein